MEIADKNSICEIKYPVDQACLTRDMRPAGCKFDMLAVDGLNIDQTQSKTGFKNKKTA